MTSCVLVMGIITCTDLPPKLTPAEAAAIVAPHQFIGGSTIPYRPPVESVQTSPTAGPFGEFKEHAPARRLDGSLLSDPPLIYGLPYGPHRFYGPYWADYSHDWQRTRLAPRAGLGSAQQRKGAER
jgi:hypothetical protein